LRDPIVKPEGKIQPSSVRSQNSRKLNPTIFYVYFPRAQQPFVGRPLDVSGRGGDGTVDKHGDNLIIACTT
jgi:hypothetical protein